MDGSGRSRQGASRFSHRSGAGSEQQGIPSVDERGPPARGVEPPQYHAFHGLLCSAADDCHAVLSPWQSLPASPTGDARPSTFREGALVAEAHRDAAGRELRDAVLAQSKAARDPRRLAESESAFGSRVGSQSPPVPLEDRGFRTSPHARRSREQYCRLQNHQSEMDGSGGNQELVLGQSRGRVQLRHHHVGDADMAAAVRGHDDGAGDVFHSYHGQSAGGASCGGAAGLPGPIFGSVFGSDEEVLDAESGGATRV
mmetsp:Transcript_3402/g.5731  ORF Transcript_3402/g.5731 Transcript_3402/m.5731 type:complete len:256 (+) Transcript_3402:530-1297(+)